MKHIYKKNGNWHERWVEVEQIPLSKTEVGDKVYIAGNIIGEKPTAMYGPHKVHNTKTMQLINRKGTVFYERMEVYREN